MCLILQTKLNKTQTKRKGKKKDNSQLKTKTLNKNKKKIIILTKTRSQDIIIKSRNHQNTNQTLRILTNTAKPSIKDRGAMKDRTKTQNTECKVQANS